ncbi:MAG: GspH/FimT family pseudopilin [Marinobacterium sp.]
MDHAPPPTRCWQRGLTLIELMVAIVVLAILVSVGPASFASILQTSRLKSAQNDLVTLLQLARSTAVSRNQRVTLCRSGNGANCAGQQRQGEQAWQGALAFVDLDQNRQVGANETVFYVANFTSPVFIIWNRGDSLVYQPDGSALGGSNGTFTISTAGSPYSRLVVVSLLGRIRTATVGG